VGKSFYNNNSIYLIIESLEKFFNTQSVDSILVIGLGILSIILNAASVLLVKDANIITSKIEKYLQSAYHISHITLQAEYDKDDNKNLLH
jgi:Co/Zn/Cd efflux system component